MKNKNKIDKITFIGMGLINSSLARDLKSNKFYKSSTAYSRRKSTLKKIEKLNLVDYVESDLEKSVLDADLIIVGIPVAAYEETFRQIRYNLKPGAIITDVGSVKKEVINIIGGDGKHHHTDFEQSSRKLYNFNDRILYPCK